MEPWPAIMAIINTILQNNNKRPTPQQQQQQPGLMNKVNTIVTLASVLDRLGSTQPRQQYMLPMVPKQQGGLRWPQ